MDTWSKTWSMKFDVAKCKVMHIGRHNPRHQYTMSGEPLQSVSAEKDIGVQVSENLKPGEQCKQAAKTARNVLYQLL